MLTSEAETHRRLRMSTVIFVLFGRHPMTDFEYVCCSDDPEKVIKHARGSYFSSFHISVKGEEGSGEIFTATKALKAYMDVRLGKDTPEARDLKAFRALVSPRGERFAKGW